MSRKTKRLETQLEGIQDIAPWQSPAPGEVWALTQMLPTAKQTIIRAWTFYEEVYDHGPLSLSPHDVSIQAGYRVWPPVEPTEGDLHAAVEVLLALIEKRDVQAGDAS